MIRLAAALSLCATSLFADCPPPPDHSVEMARLIEGVRTAPDEGAAQPYMAAMWALWRTAPDDRAQDLLDRGIARRESYDYAGARVLFDELVDYCPGYAEGYNQRAFANFLSGNFEPALTDLDIVLELSPTHSAALSGKALTLMSLGRMELAQSVLRQAVGLNPWLPERAYLIEPPGQKL